MPQPNSKTTGQPQLGATIFNVAWMAIALGLVMQFLVLLVQASAGKTPAIPAFAADAMQKVSWSFLVCAGLAAGSLARSARGAAMGLAGFLSAPVAFTAARSLHKSVQQALSIAGSATAASPVILAGIKAVEYACLGFLLARLSGRPQTGAKAHALTGLGVGVVFGGFIVWTITRSAAQAGTVMATPAVVSTAVNEILFPVGCSLVIHAAHTLGRRAAGTDS